LLPSSLTVNSYSLLSFFLDSSCYFYVRFVTIPFLLTFPTLPLRHTISFRSTIFFSVPLSYLFYPPPLSPTLSCTLLSPPPSLSPSSLASILPSLFFPFPPPPPYFVYYSLPFLPQTLDPLYFLLFGPLSFSPPPSFIPPFPSPLSLLLPLTPFSFHLSPPFFSLPLLPLFPSISFFPPQGFSLCCFSPHQEQCPPVFRACDISSSGGRLPVRTCSWVFGSVTFSFFFP